MAELNEKELQEIVGGKGKVLPGYDIDEEIMQRYHNGEITVEELIEIIEKSKIRN